MTPSMTCRFSDELLCHYNLVMKGAKAHSNAHFGEGVGKILLDEVACTGTERDLIVCPSNGIENHDCRHHEDAGVSCVGNNAPLTSLCMHRFDQVFTFMFFLHRRACRGPQRG